MPQEDILNSPVIDPDFHDRLIQNLEGFARDANITPFWIGEPAQDHLPDTVLEWLRGIRNPQSHDLLLDNSSKLDGQVVCSAMAGALLRNYIGVKVMSLSDFIMTVEKHSPASETCVLIPNFHTKGDSASLAPWRRGLLLDGLVKRQLAGHRTVLITNDAKAAGVDYGPGIRALLENSYEMHVV